MRHLIGSCKHARNRKSNSLKMDFGHTAKMIVEEWPRNTEMTQNEFLISGHISPLCAGFPIFGPDARNWFSPSRHVCESGLAMMLLQHLCIAQYLCFCRINVVVGACILRSISALPGRQKRTPPGSQKNTKQRATQFILPTATNLFVKCSETPTACFLLLRAKGDRPKVTEPNLRFPSVFCEDLRFSAKNLRFPAPSKWWDFQEKR